MTNANELLEDYRRVDEKYEQYLSSLITKYGEDKTLDIDYTVSHLGSDGNYYNEKFQNIAIKNGRPILLNDNGYLRSVSSVMDFSESINFLRTVEKRYVK